MGGPDPFRDDLGPARERLAKLQADVEERRAFIKHAWHRLGQKYESARVPEKRWARRSPKRTFNTIVAVLWTLTVGMLAGIHVFGWIFVVAPPLVFGVLLLVWTKWPRKPRVFNPQRYEESVTPTHLSAERRDLEQQVVDLIALEEELDETSRFVEARDRKA